VARKRQARRCRAHRSDGRPCKAYAILGVSPEHVTPGDLLWLAVDDQIPREDAMPKIRVDRRPGPRTRAQLATRAARQAARMTP